MSLISELKRRNVFRVALAYGAGAWVLIGGMDILTGLIESPPWLMKFVVGAAALGFLPVLIFSWVYEMTPEGLRKEEDIAPDAPRSTHRLNIAILVVLLLAVGLAVFEKLQRVESTGDLIDSQVQNTDDGPPMVAVLPFGRASSGEDSEFFSNGIHEDLLTQLAQLHSIRVISRTSVLEYKDVARNIRQIGQELGADAILEGSVQSSGERIRINAQLIDSRSDEHLWAQTYDRELSPANIFEVQTEIAGAIASALEKTLSPQDTAQLSVIPTENMAAYRAFHRALDIRASGFGYLTGDYFDALTQAVTLDPDFTRAWVELVGFHSYVAFGDDGDTAEVMQAEQTLERVRELAPGSADYFTAQAYYTYYVVRDYDLALELVSKALELRPSDVHFLELKSWIQRRLGDFQGRSDSLRQARKLDPRNPLWTDSLVFNLFLMHDYDEVRKEAEASAFPIYDAEYFLTMLDFWEHRDLDRWVKEAKAVNARFAGENTSRLHWEHLIAQLRYQSAANLAESFLEAQGLAAEESDELEISKALEPSNVEILWRTRWLVAHWFMHDRVLPNGLAGMTQALVDTVGHPFDYNSSISYIAMAQLYAINGNVEQTRQVLNRWRLAAGAQGTEFSYSLHETCQVLGMIGEATAAVDCIREALDQPSLVTPFLEPFLPFYDSVRDHPDFVALTEELN